MVNVPTVTNPTQALVEVSLLPNTGADTGPDPYLSMKEYGTTILILIQILPADIPPRRIQFKLIDSLLKAFN